MCRTSGVQLVDDVVYSSWKLRHVSAAVEVSPIASVCVIIITFVVLMTLLFLAATTWSKRGTPGHCLILERYDARNEIDVTRKVYFLLTAKWLPRLSHNTKKSKRGTNNEDRAILARNQLMP